MDTPPAYRDRIEGEEVGLGDGFVESTGVQYEYEHLNEKASDTFRLLLLQPGTWNDPLEGTLVVTRQSGGIDYAALSYLWGETKRRNPISIDGRHLSIGANLSMFLKYLRHPDQTLTLWSDAICIDQENTSERGHQVRLMGDIYRGASNVYAWLGEDTHDIATLTSFLSKKDVSRASSSLQEASKLPKDGHRMPLIKARTKEIAQHLITGRNSPSRNVKIIGGELQKNIIESRNPYRLINAVNKTIDPLERHARRAFVDLYKRPYWMRMWVIQELLLARSVIICLGQTRLTWKSFAATIDSGELQWPAVIWRKPCDSVPEVDSLQYLIEMMELPVKDRYSSLGNLLERYSEQKCLDARDRIYALLSLARDCDMIVPDYTQNRLDLFFQLKDTVHNHTILHRALDLCIDEIMYRAETLGIHCTVASNEISLNINPAAENAYQVLGESFDRAAQRIKARAWAGNFDAYTHWGRTNRTVTMCEKHQTVRARLYSYPHRWDVKLESGVTGILLATDLELWVPASGTWQRADIWIRSVEAKSEYGESAISEPNFDF